MVRISCGGVLLGVVACHGELSLNCPCSVPANYASATTLHGVTPSVAVCNAMGYDASVIKAFAHKGLGRFFATGNTAGIQAIHAARLRLILAMLDEATSAGDMGAPGLRLHPLKGELKGHWAVTVQANWRVTFRFENGDAYVVDYRDYH